LELLASAEVSDQLQRFFDTDFAASYSNPGSTPLLSDANPASKLEPDLAAHLEQKGTGVFIGHQALHRH
jgi:hypothetical protein